MYPTDHSACCGKNGYGASLRDQSVGVSRVSCKRDNFLGGWVRRVGAGRVGKVWTDTYFLFVTISVGSDMTEEAVEALVRAQWQRVDDLIDKYKKKCDAIKVGILS